MAEIPLELGEFNIYQLNEVLRIFNKINYDNIKKEFNSYISIYGKSKIKLYYNLFKLYHDKIKEILKKIIFENKNYITNKEYFELRLLIQYTNLLIINPVIIGLIKFYFSNFSFDIIYLLQKNLNPSGSGYSGNPIKIANYGQYTIKKYLIGFIPKLEINEQLKQIYQIEYEKLLDINKDIGFDTISTNYFKSEYLRHINAIDENEIKSLDDIKINIIQNKEVLQDISSAINTVFDKKTAREKYTTSIIGILQSKEEIQQNELYNNLNEYLQLFGNKEELEKLNEKYKNYIGYLKIKEQLIKVINFITDKLAQEIPEDKQDIKVIFNFLIKIIYEDLLKEDKDISISKNLISILFLIEELKNLIDSSEIQNIINTIYQLIDFFIDYININYEIIIKEKEVLPTYDKINEKELTGLIKMGGNNYNKKLLKNYK